jgi:hypothetical protein
LQRTHEKPPKLAVILHRMSADGAEFRFGKEQGAAAGVLAV